MTFDVAAGASTLTLTGLPVDKLRSMDVVKLDPDGGDLWIDFALNVAIPEDPGVLLVPGGSFYATPVVSAVDIRAHLKAGAPDPTIGVDYDLGGKVYLQAHEEH